uniref:C2 domain-containing protein n=1 Tax=Haemonchus contortus TaxID=6289 RepID=A0A7I4YAX6_HAECO|nr:unnamed protein product [Haemonchus contortus]
MFPTPRLASEVRLEISLSGLAERNGMSRKKAVKVYHVTQTIHDKSQSSNLRWTSKSPGGQFTNEMGHNIFGRKFCLVDAAVVPKFYKGSDHRLLRVRIYFSPRGERVMKLGKRCFTTFKD